MGMVEVLDHSTLGKLLVIVVALVNRRFYNV